MKRIILLLSISALFVCIVSCEKDENEVVTIDVTSVSLYYYWYWWYEAGSDIKFQHYFSKFN